MVGSPFAAVEVREMPSTFGIPALLVLCDGVEEEDECDEDPHAAREPASARVAKTARACRRIEKCVCFLFIEPMVTRRLVKIGSYGQAADSFPTRHRSDR